MLNPQQQKIIRVFPSRNNYTPVDEYVFIGDPPLFRPEAKEVHVSVTFTWDVKEGHRLYKAWSKYYSTVKIGGPAIEGTDLCGEFEPGMYLKHGTTITSRGCIRKCPWCVIPESEGSMKLLEIKAGHILQDNNILATPREHQLKVYQMLKIQKKAAILAGGIDVRLVDSWVAEQLKCLRINQLFLAADTDEMLEPLRRAVHYLQFLGRKKLRCYVLIGFRDEAITDAENRLKAVWNMGCLPFALLYQRAEGRNIYSKPWRDLAREWSRPAAMISQYEGKQL